MIQKRHLLVAILATFCLSVTLFTVLPIRSSSTKSAATASASNYDPWADTNDDGLIDMNDIGYLASLFLASGTPINKTALLLDLQNRVGALEEKQDYVKTIRLYTPNETMQNGNPTEDAAVFCWNPQNVTNNAVLTMYCYFEYLGGTVQNPLIWGLWMNGTNMCAGQLYSQEYEQTPVYSFIPPDAGVNEPYIAKPNQNSYKIEFTIASVVPTYVKNINVLLQVMDGLPPS